VNIFDDRGELVRQLCGTWVSSSPDTPVLSFGVYQPVPGNTGGLLPILLNGIVAADWDSKDQQGKIVPNGFYQIVIIQSPVLSNSAIPSKDVYIDPSHSQTSLQLSASPNFAEEGTLVIFRSEIQGFPAGPNNEPLRIFTLAGELVKTLPWQNGQTSWDLTRLSGQTVASGLYLASEEASDVLSGTKIHKTVKVIVLK
jgi:hypothetical protein